MDTSFQEQYASLSDDELLHIAGDRRDLLEHAAVALDTEMARRGLSYEQARARRKAHIRREIAEMRTRSSKRNKSKYFAAQMNLPAFLAGIAGEVVLILLFGGHPVRKEWEWPIVVVYLGALTAVLSVQPWVRRTVSFWVSLVSSFLPQLLVAHWLAVYHPANSRGGEKGAAFISLFAGWSVAVPLFLMLQKLRQDNGANAAQ